MAWWVVFGHISNIIGLRKISEGTVWEVAIRVIEGGEWPVAVFIILSGFVITHLILTKKQKYPVYIIERFFRIAPLYYFALFFAILVAGQYYLAFYVNEYAISREMRLDRIASVNENFLLHFFLHISMLHGVIPDSLLPYSGSAFLSPGWSLSLEWQFYLFAPIVIMSLSWFMSNDRYVLNVVLSVVALVCVFFSNKIEYQYLSFLISAFPYFFVGVLTRVFFERWSFFALFFSIALVFSMAMSRGSLSFIPPIFIWLFFVCFVFILDGSFAKKFVSIFFGNSIVRFFGECSYSTYLIHIPVISLSVASAIDVFGMDYLIIVFGSLFGAFLTIPISYFCYKYIELPGIGFGKRFSRLFK